MLNIKNAITSTAIAGAMIASLAMPAFAVKPATVPGSWDVTGTYVIEFKLDGDLINTYPHDAFLTQTGASVTGNGGYLAGNPPYSFAWDITTGNVTGSNIDLTIDYTVGAIGTTMNMTGVIAQDGTLSGTWSDNYNGGIRTGTWETTSGNAIRFEGNHGQYVKSQENKQEAAQSRVGMPVQSQGNTN